ncbi:MAG TPA: alpha/beta fold hydrolase [Ramlibacter sp.]|nr:alpha/beta fold hydrolase [Ramlibacter sp.]
MSLREVAPGLRLYVSDEGSGDAIVFLHALGTDSSIWQPQRAQLVRTHRVVCIDAPGHGGSPLWPAVSLQGLAEAVWRVADQLGVARIALVGTSMGAVVALRAAALQPARVDRVVLCAARLVRGGAQGHDLARRSASALQGDLAEVADAMVERWFPPPAQVPDAIRRQVRELVLRTSPAGYAACAQACSAYDLSAELALLQQRCWLVAGEHDEQVPAHFEALGRACPAARVVLVRGAGHFPNLERPALFNALLAEETGSRQARQA